MKTLFHKTRAARTLHLGLVGVLLATALAVIAEAQMYRGYELPPYEVTKTDGNVELRSYQPHLLAEVTVRGERSRAISTGFRTLAGYIFGGNVQDEKVAMTVPVSQTLADEGLWTVRFMMPSDYTLETLPQAQDPAIRFVTTSPEDQLVIQFSGRSTDAVLIEKTEELRRFAAKEGLQIAGEPRYYFYDDPFSLPWNRRNEVAFVLQP